MTIAETWLTVLVIWIVVPGLAWLFCYPDQEQGPTVDPDSVPTPITPLETRRIHWRAEIESHRRVH